MYSKRLRIEKELFVTDMHVHVSAARGWKQKRNTLIMFLCLVTARDKIQKRDASCLMCLCPHNKK